MEWTGTDTFEIDNVNFRIDCTDGGDGAKTDAKEFVIAKYPSFIERYLGLRYSGFRKILELGVFEGGSFVFIDKLLKPDRISAVELWDRPRPHLEAYVKENAPRTKVHCPVSQGDPEALSQIIEQDFGGEVDLVIDDASHFYDLTKISFLSIYPRLRPGGLYIIEDWGWSFHQTFQGATAPWADQKALVNLIFELLEEVSLNNSIVDLTVTADMVMIRKPLTPPNSPLLTLHGRRGRNMPNL